MIAGILIVLALVALVVFIAIRDGKDEPHVPTEGVTPTRPGRGPRNPGEHWE